MWITSSLGVVAFFPPKQKSHRLSFPAKLVVEAQNVWKKKIPTLIPCDAFIWGGVSLSLCEATTRSKINMLKLPVLEQQRQQVCVKGEMS